jgi:carbon monoxide dehydrogenase subunit G
VHFENRVMVPTSRDNFWRLLMDIQRTATCLPGAEDVIEVAPDEYVGKMRVKVGPVALRFEGKMTIIERDDAQWRATMKADGTDRKAGASVKSTVVLELFEVEPSETELVVTTEAILLGRLAEFGNAVMLKKADLIMQEFSQRVGELFSTNAQEPA